MWGGCGGVFRGSDAEMHDFNVGSGRVLRKVGFEHEGTLKWGIWKGGRLAGLEIWGLVRESAVNFCCCSCFLLLSVITSLA